MKFVFILILLSVLQFVRPRCDCPFMCGAGYDGTEAQCFCFCDQDAGNFPSGSSITCSYFPSGEFSTGGCSLCGPDSTFDEVSQVDSKSGVKVTGITKQNNLRGSVPFPLYVCYCPQECDWGYTGTYDECVSWANSQASRFLNGVEQITYFPWGEFSSGGCSACGHADPCTIN
ncbi:hypothetical protein M0811_06141 [Anaeramoeba ignava]|uniref:Uncharacterized protein n=1 Tax=Anaeramoeba ignava TaxID=1746090 RepID=A0A9Q0LPV5_ANAIG|nr:hypothetical protein M0811_06141 [Anaeramoeba ignava]|eukprot:Anaeramoba_ignava/c15957_g1_i1.p1 GENE.c15957_g1_i1~~c15957_g1_i1.p1  ORF type:complete len:173 (-),score=37.98 c15957_g1_i1:102-620(-)